MPVNSSTSSHASNKSARSNRASNSNDSAVQRAPQVLWPLMCLLAAACSSGKDAPKQAGPSAQELEQRLLRISEAAIVSKQATDSPLCPWEKLATTLPDTLGRLVAVAPATGHTDDDTALMSKATRAYAAEGQTVTLELLDAAHSPSLLMAFMLQHAATAQNRDTKGDQGEELNATRIGAHHTLTRYNAQSREASAQVMLAQRFLIEVRLAPGDNENAALQIASALPLSAIAALDPRAAEPSDAPTPIAADQPTEDPDDDSPDQL